MIEKLLGIQIINFYKYSNSRSPSKALRATACAYPNNSYPSNSCQCCNYRAMAELPL